MPPTPNPSREKMSMFQIELIKRPEGTDGYSVGYRLPNHAPVFLAQYQAGSQGNAEALAFKAGLRAGLKLAALVMKNYAESSK